MARYGKSRRLVSRRNRRMRARTKKQRTYYVSRGGIRL
jgi:hypothetical protein